MKQEDKTMRDKVKRFLSILMTALMLVNLLPVGALAEGVTISNSVQSRGYQKPSANVYVYVKVTGDKAGLTINPSGWYTIGKSENVPGMGTPYWSMHGSHSFSDVGVSYKTVLKTNFTRWTDNQKIDLDQITWTEFYVDNGADDYVKAGTCTWNMNGTIDIKHLPSVYTIKYVDYDTKELIHSYEVTGLMGQKPEKITAPDSLQENLYSFYFVNGHPKEQTVDFKKDKGELTFYYKKNTANYTVNYYLEGTQEKVKDSITGTAALRDTVNPDTEVTGYTLVPGQVTSLTIGKDENKNVLNLYYTKNNYEYTVNYFYDNVEDVEKRVKGSAPYQDTITYEDKAGKGYQLERVEPDTGSLTIGTNPDDNVINVYYKSRTTHVSYGIEGPGDLSYTTNPDNKDQDTVRVTTGDITRGGNVQDDDFVLVTAVPKKEGYVVNWYRMNGQGENDTLVASGQTLTVAAAKAHLKKDSDGLYTSTVYHAKIVPNTGLTATVTYKVADGQEAYGKVDPAGEYTILQATGELVVDGKVKSGEYVPSSTATANTGYKFVGWYKSGAKKPIQNNANLEGKDNLNQDAKTNLYQATVFEARFEPDAGAKVPVTYEAENGTLEGTTSQEAQVVTGEGLTDVTATPNTGYKFDGWYVVDKNGDKHRLDPAEKLDAKTAKKNLNKDGNLYAETTFIARFVPDENQTVPVIYTTDGNGTLWGGPAIGSITYNVNIATGKVWLNNTFVDKLEPVPTYPKEGYEFDRWIRVFPEKTIEDASSTLTDEKARPNLNQEDGLYQKTEFKAIFKPQTNLSYTVNYYWNGTTEKVTESKTIGGKMFGEEMTESPIGVEGYTPVSTESQTITLGTGKNEINFYYYKNVKLIANSDTKTYNGKNQSVSGYTCAVAEMKNGRLEYVPWTGEPLTFEFAGAFGSGTDAGDYDVTFKEGSVGENNGLYYVKEVQPGTLTIKPAPIKLRAPIASKPYDGMPLKAEDYGYGYEGNTDLADDFKSISVEGSQTMVGSSASSVTYTLKDRKKSQNYDIQCIPGTLTITPVTDEVVVEITGTTDSVTYDGQLHKVEGYVASSISNSLYKDSDFTYNGDAKAEGTDAGEYKMGLTDDRFQNNNENFANVTFKVVEDGKLTISKRNVKLTSASDSKVYDGTPLTKPVVAVTGEGFVAGEVTDIKATGTITDVGSVTNTITFTPVEGKFNAENYSIEFAPGTLTINPVAEVVVTITGKTETVTYDGSEKTAKGYDVSISNPLYKESDFTYSGTAEAKGTDANTYPMNLKAEQFSNTNKNFSKVTFVVEKDGQLVIEKRAVNLSSGTVSKTYDGTPLTSDMVTIEGDGFIEEEAWDVEAIGSVKDVSEGEVTNTITFKTSDKFNADNYTITKTEGKLKVTPRSVTLTSASDSKVYDGTPLTNDTVTAVGFVEGQGATYNVTGSQTLVGSSDNEFTYELNSNTKADNYKITTKFGKLEVTPVTEEVIVTITGRTDEMPYDGKEHSVFGFDAKPSNKLYNPKEDMQFNGTDVDMTAKGTDAGQYDIGLTAEHFTNKSDNFSKVTFVVTDGYVKINPRAVTLTSETAGKTYDGTALEKPVVTVGGDGFVEGQVKEIKATGSVTNAGSVANTITFTPNKETFKEGNYAITKTEGTLTIAKRSVLITSQSATKTYDGSALTRPAVTITGDGFVPGELAKAEATGSITNVGSTPNTIRYTTTGAFNAANYSIALSVGTLTVTEKPKPEPRRTFNLTINYVYQNGKRAAASYNRGGLKNGETFDITSPVIAGYTASETVVSGTIYNRDIKVTVIYTADGVNLDDYGVPLGLGNITMNVGDCFE